MLDFYGPGSTVGLFTKVLLQTWSLCYDTMRAMVHQAIDLYSSITTIEDHHQICGLLLTETSIWGA
jgi:hypothetical protein